MRAPPTKAHPGSQGSPSTFSGAFALLPGGFETMVPAMSLADPCQGETYEGRCDGSTVIWCENAQVKQISCQSCGFDVAKGYYNCQ